MQAYDYYELLVAEGFGINSGIYGTLFYTMTGFHGAHVLGGVSVSRSCSAVAWQGSSPASITSQSRP